MRAGQVVSITGQQAPLGQLALLDAKITVHDGGTVVLVAVHLSQPATVAPEGDLQITAGSVAEQAVEVLKIPTSPPGSELPPCTERMGPSFIATRDPDLHMDVVMACTSKAGTGATWSPMVTSGGVISDGIDIQALVAAIGSGLTGMFVLRLEGAGPFEFPAMALLPFQEVRVLCTDVDAVLVRGRIDLGKSSALYFSGTIGTLTLELDQPITFASDTALIVDGTIGLAPATVANVLSPHDDGTVAISEGGSVTALNTAGVPVGTVSGSQPGSFSVVLTAPIVDGGGEGELTCDGSDIDGFFVALFGMQVRANCSGGIVTNPKLPISQLSTDIQNLCCKDSVDRISSIAGSDQDGGRWRQRWQSTRVGTRRPRWRRWVGRRNDHHAIRRRIFDHRGRAWIRYRTAHPI